MRLVYSSERKQDIRLQMGKTHYSYRFSESKFVAVFERMGMDPILIDAPESLKHPSAFQGLFGCAPEEVIHIAFRSTENLRPVVGAHNICHFAWEFDVLRTENLTSESVTDNQLHMLNLFDEVWVPCRYTYEVLARHGVQNLQLVRIPVCPGDPLPRLTFHAAAELLGNIPSAPLVISSAAGREGNCALVASYLTALGNHRAILDRIDEGKIFLFICNPYDMRKNIINTIEGFLLGARPQDILIIKLLVPNEGDFILETLPDRILPLYNGPVAKFSNQIVFIFDYLSNEQMVALYSIADFYLSAPHCEGYNLPLLESMAHGTVPVSNRVTAMADYIDADDAVLIDSKLFEGLLRGMAGDVSRRSYSVHISSQYDVGRAVRSALALSLSQYQTKAEAAQKMVSAHHSEQAIIPLLRTLLHREGTIAAPTLGAI